MIARRWRYPRLAIAIGLLLFATGFGARTQTAAPPEVVWPNRESRANSDDWLRLHHNQIRQLRPRVLVLNFVNGLSSDEASRRVNALIAAVRESSRYQGYRSASAAPFLDYQVFKLVNLANTVPLPPDQRLDGNSSDYPRPPDWREGMVNFRYDELFSDKFTELYDVPDPNRPSKKLTLEEMVNHGVINEVWFLAVQGRFGAPQPCTEVKQAYDAELRKMDGRFVQAGFGIANEQPFIGRSLRILHINPERGPGCALEHLSRAMEGMAASKAVPYFTRYFGEFAGFDLKRRYSLPFDSLGGRDGGTEVDYPTRSTMKYRYKGEYYTVRNYVAAGGSVLFPPSARREFDMDSPLTVLSAVEHFRLHDGENGKDLTEPWSSAKFARYRGVANDCMGPYLVYWRQSMPGLDNKALDDAGKPMRNWWPFLFY